MIFFAGKEITGLSDCCFVRVKTVSKQNMPCVIFRSLSEFSDYELGQALSKDFRGSLPTIEEIEKELESDRQ